MTLLVTFLLAFAVILAVIGAMAVGILYGREPIRGSCGGLNGGQCEICSSLRRETCDEEARQ
jgi:hypothetical protein